MKITDWVDRPISDTSVESLYWVSGLAGIGKSSIARTIAEYSDRRRLLGASFFFSRQEEELSDAKLFIPTIAYQLAQSYPEVKSAVVKVLRQDRDIVKKSFSTQLQQLILEPLRNLASPRPVLLVVDAFDECRNSDDAATKLLHTVVTCCTKAPSFRLLITSRPESYIKNVLMGFQIARISLHEDVEESVIRNDIRRYLRVEMSRIPEKPGVRLLTPWPSESDLTKLADKAGKLFIWAAIAVRYVRDGWGVSPASRLDMLLNGRAIDPYGNTENPFVALDDLYEAILFQAANDLPGTHVSDMRIVIGTVFRLRSEMPLEAIGRFLGKGTVKMFLGRIQSIIPIPTDASRPIQFYHPSFPDFVTNRERCHHSQLYVNIPDHERQLALRCLDILNSHLSKNIDLLLMPTEDLSVVSKEAVLRTIPPEVQYACRFWQSMLHFSVWIMAMKNLRRS